MLLSGAQVFKTAPSFTLLIDFISEKECVVLIQRLMSCKCELTVQTSSPKPQQQFNINAGVYLVYLIISSVYVLFQKYRCQMIPLLLYFHIHIFSCLDGILSDRIFMDFILIYVLCAGSQLRPSRLSYLSGERSPVTK